MSRLLYNSSCPSSYIEVITFFGVYPMTSTTGTPLRRSRHNRVVAGICGGLAEFFGISAFWFRLAFLIALIPGGVPGLLTYLLFWLMIPKANGCQTAVTRK